LGFQEVEAPEFLDNRHRKVVRLSALRTGRLYPQEGFLLKTGNSQNVQVKSTPRITILLEKLIVFKVVKISCLLTSRTLPALLLSK
jgi:hypothetical protein